MTMMSYQGIAGFAVAGLVGIAACGTVGDNPPTTIEAPTSARFVIGQSTTATPELGKLKVCKARESNVAGSFAFALVERFGTPGAGYLAEALAELALQPGECRVVAEDNGGDGVGTRLRITEVATNLVSVSGERVDQEVGGSALNFSTLDIGNGGIAVVNIYHGATVTFLNHREVEEPPPVAVCDFITFGRLVTEVNGKKVVISGNAGGNKPGGGILGEFHIEANGVDNHVTDIDSYVPAGALLNLTNARIVKGIAKNGVAVELRLWDGGEPGKGTDRVWVKLGNSVLIGGPLGQLIDQGNMQYHANCRGPGDASLD
jgi:hypothetical protein